MSFVEERVLPQVLRVHDAVYRKTNGWIGHRTLWIPSLLLHTVGAKTGRQRTTSLTYARDGDNYLVVASKGGAPEAPGWYHNLKAKPDVEIHVGPRRFAVTAQPVLPDDADYPRLWPALRRRRRDAAPVADLQQEQPKPLHRIPEADVAIHPRRRPDPERLEQLFREQFQRHLARRCVRRVGSAIEQSKR